METHAMKLPARNFYSNVNARRGLKLQLSSQQSVVDFSKCESEWLSVSLW